MCRTTTSHGFQEGLHCTHNSSPTLFTWLIKVWIHTTINNDLILSVNTININIDTCRPGRWTLLYIPVLNTEIFNSTREKKKWNASRWGLGYHTALYPLLCSRSMNMCEVVLCLYEPVWVGSDSCIPGILKDVIEWILSFASCVVHRSPVSTSIPREGCQVPGIGRSVCDATRGPFQIATDHAFLRWYTRTTHTTAAGEIRKARSAAPTAAAAGAAEQQRDNPICMVRRSSREPTE